MRFCFIFWLVGHTIRSLLPISNTQQTCSQSALNTRKSYLVENRMSTHNLYPSTPFLSTTTDNSNQYHDTLKSEIHLDQQLTSSYHVHLKRYEINRPIRQLSWLLTRPSALLLPCKRLLYLVILRPDLYFQFVLTYSLFEIMLCLLAMNFVSIDTRIHWHWSYSIFLRHPLSSLAPLCRHSHVTRYIPSFLCSKLFFLLFVIMYRLLLSRERFSSKNFFLKLSKYIL